MKFISFLISLSLTCGLVYFLWQPISFTKEGPDQKEKETTLPPLGAFFSPFTGFWQNGEPAGQPTVRIDGGSGQPIAPQIKPVGQQEFARWKLSPEESQAWNWFSGSVQVPIGSYRASASLQEYLAERPILLGGDLAPPR